MPVPKQKSPRSRRGNRRGHQKVRVTAPQACPKCNEPKVPHRVCRHCGYYKGMEIIEVEE